MSKDHTLERGGERERGGGGKREKEREEEGGKKDGGIKRSSEPYHTFLNLIINN